MMMEQNYLILSIIFTPSNLCSGKLDLPECQLTEIDFLSLRQQREQRKSHYLNRGSLVSVFLHNSQSF